MMMILPLQVYYTTKTVQINLILIRKMTITNTNVRITIEGNGTNKNFDFGFFIPTADDLRLIYTNLEGIETEITSNFTISNIGNYNGGTVIYPTIGDAILSGEYITIKRVLAEKQQTDLLNQSTIRAETIEKALDNNVMISQQLREKLDRCLTFKESSSLKNLTIEDFKPLKLLYISEDGKTVKMSKNNFFTLEEKLEIVAGMSDEVKVVAENLIDINAYADSKIAENIGLINNNTTLINSNTALINNNTTLINQKEIDIKAYLDSQIQANKVLIDLNSTNISANTTLINQKPTPNHLTNPSFNIWQNGTSISSGYGIYTADQWKIWVEQTGGGIMNVSRQEHSIAETEEIEGRPRYFCRLDHTNPSVNQKSIFEQLLEDLRKFAGKTMTASFWARCNDTSGINIEIDALNYYGASGSSAEFSQINQISIDTNWKKYSITINTPSAIGKIIELDSFFALRFFLPLNKTFQLDLSSIKLEDGNIATPFEAENSAVELSKCQRYFEKSYNLDIKAGTAAGAILWLNGAYADTYLAMTSIQFKERKRVAPSVTIYSIDGSINKVSSYSGNLTVSSVVDVGTGGIGRVYTSNTSSPIANSWRACHFVADSRI
jgi:hypothetical protein